MTYLKEITPETSVETKPKRGEDIAETRVSQGGQIEGLFGLRARSEQGFYSESTSTPRKPYAVGQTSTVLFPFSTHERVERKVFFGFKEAAK